MEPIELPNLGQVIKPANILVHDYRGDPFRVKLLDFGLAKPVDPEATRITRKGRVVGTPRYMSLEQILGEHLGPPRCWSRPSLR